MIENFGVEKKAREYEKNKKGRKKERKIKRKEEKKN